MLIQTGNELARESRRLETVREFVEMWNPYKWLPIFNWFVLLDEPICEFTRGIDSIVSSQDVAYSLHDIFSKQEEFGEGTLDVEQCSIAGYRLFDLLQTRGLLRDCGLRRD